VPVLQLLRRSATVFEQHALRPTGSFQRQATRAVWPARRHIAQQLQILLRQRAFTAGCQRGGAEFNSEAVLLRVSAAKGVAIGLARQRAIGVEDDGVVLRIRYDQCRVGRRIGYMRPLPDDALN